MPPTPSVYRLSLMLAYHRAKAEGYHGLAAGFARLLRLEFSR